MYRVKDGANKYRTLLTPKDMPHLPPGIEIATGALMKQHPDKLRALLAGRREAVKYIYEHTDDAIKILAKLYAPLPPDKVADMVHELVAAKFWSEGNIEMPLLETVRACDARRRHAQGQGRPDEDDRHLVPAERSAEDNRSRHERGARG